MTVREGMAVAIDGEIYRDAYVVRLKIGGGKAPDSCVARLVLASL